MDQTLTGTIHGNTIVLDAPASAPEGTRVEVVVRDRKTPSSPAAAGATKEQLPSWWNAEDDRILEEIRQARSHSTRSEVAE